MFKKEIGGYFEIENTDERLNHEYHDGLISLNTARNALAYLIESKKITKLYLPYYLCLSVVGVCVREHCSYAFYNIDESFKPLLAEKIGPNEYVYIVNYFGILQDDEIVELQRRYGRIILDNVQVFFKKPNNGIDCIYSCRKFFGVPDGAYLYTNTRINRELDVDDSSNRMTHLFGRKKDGASAHYNDFKSNDASFKELPLRTMSPQTHNLLKHVDYLKVKTQRDINFLFLDQKLRHYNKLNIGESMSNGPYCYPLLINNGQKLRKKLIANSIYVPLLWPDINMPNDSVENNYINNILPLPCDQRYSLEDMESMVDLIVGKPRIIDCLSETNFTRAKIKELTIDYVDDMLKWHNDERLYDSLFGECNHPSYNVEKDWVIEYVINHNNECFRGIVFDERDAPIGAGYLFGNDVNGEKIVHLHIFIGEESSRGKGYGKDAMMLLILYAFSQMNASKIVLSVFKDNIPAVNLYEKCGFKITKENNHYVFKKNKGWKDVYEMSLSREEFVLY